MSINPGGINTVKLSSVNRPRLKESADAMKFRTAIGCADVFKDAIM
jgi:hypothetical protein